MPEPTIRDVAEQIQAELPGLMGTEAADVGRELAAALDGEDEDEIFAVLTSREPTRERLDALLPEDLASGERGFDPLPGISSKPSEAVWFRCPEGDYEWPAFDVGESPPLCPHHQIPLVRES